MAVIRADISALDPRPRPRPSPRPRARGYLPYSRACNLHFSLPRSLTLFPYPSSTFPSVSVSFHLPSICLSIYPSVHPSVFLSLTSHPALSTPNSLYFSLPSTPFSVSLVATKRPRPLPREAHPHFLHLIIDAQCTAGSHYTPRAGYHSFESRFCVRPRCPPPRCSYIRIPARAHVRCSDGGSLQAVTNRPIDQHRQTISLSFDSRVTERTNGVWPTKGKPLYIGKSCPLYCLRIIGSNSPVKLTGNLELFYQLFISIGTSYLEYGRRRFGYTSLRFSR